MRIMGEHKLVKKWGIQMFRYTVEDTWFGSSICGKDLRVVITHKLSISHQCDAAGNMLSYVLYSAYAIVAPCFTSIQ